MNPEIPNRKGARKVDDIPDEVLELLNKGEIETANLTEWLAIDQVALITETFPSIGLEEMVQPLQEKLARQKKPSTMNSVKLVGEEVYEVSAKTNQTEVIFQNLLQHPSDTVRCYAPYLITLNNAYSIEEKLKRIKPLVADKHFGVREVVWIAARPFVDQELAKSIQVLSGWTSSGDENVRRFTSEATRPRGVWCKHIESLKENHKQGLPILEPLKSDPAKYVQDSVGNWLNDASKSRPAFVAQLCDRWKAESPTQATQKIIKRARRTIDKK
ncbi:DNA alkylation repair protein [Tunicatimonas pelagia]|uniref:DNA alkylation repair protein n=1 Tax=Tunicatimonas pelagia TaxID=931531 RepID=UPI002666DBD2|nr:DNA alkylation repair protein [Tunicatimonas pelagia]WKN46184.1 DNA alkylation repair protein [Tunicatimonas pelagia]